MDSELDLNDEIQKLHVIATVPHLYQHIVDVNAVGTILGLLSHENSGENMDTLMVPKDWKIYKFSSFFLMQ